MGRALEDLGLPENSPANWVIDPDTSLGAAQNASGPRALREGELMNLPPPQFELQGWTQQGGITFLAGARGTHKSRMLAAMGGATVTGGCCYGAQALRSGKVLAVIAEDLPGWGERWRAWRRNEGIPDSVQLCMHTWTEPVNLLTGDGFDLLRRQVSLFDPAVILFDTLSDLITGADENSQQHMTIVRHKFKQLQAGGHSLYIVHHTGYDEKHERGSSVIGGFADTIILARVHDGTIRLENTKQRNGRAFLPLELQFDPKTLVLHQTLPNPRTLSAQQATVLRALQTLALTNPTGVNVGDWKKRCVDVEGVPERTFFDAKRKLLAAGLIAEPNGDGKFIPV
jgi:AAA domain-containing protein